MPPEAISTTQSLAIQWPVVAIVIGVFVICGYFALKFWREYRDAQAKEAEANRSWQTDEASKNREVQREREESWQTFIATQGELNRQGTREMTHAITELQKRIDAGFSSVNESLAAHDARVELRVQTAQGGRKALR
jgi:hypothetical protein